MEEIVFDKFGEALRIFSMNIIPPDEYLKKGNILAQKILDILKGKSRFNIGRLIFAGSSGKKTQIFQSDMDCVVFINDEEPIFEEILDDFENILIIEQGYNIHDIRKTKFSIQFKTSGFEFDFLPAPNFVLHTESSGGGDNNLIDVQQQKTLEKIKQNPGKYRYSYSSGLAEAVVRFMKNQDGFAHEMVRLCKFWYKTVFMPESISGAKTLIELIAVYAASKENTFDTKSHLRCLSKFLNLIENFDNLNIVFGEIPNYPVPDYIKNQKPLVLEPANPYNNLAKYWTPQSKVMLKNYATETLRRIGLTSHHAASTKGLYLIPMEHLFEPQPKVAPFQGSKLRRAAYFVSSSADVLNFPDVKVRNEGVMKAFDIVNDSNVFLNYMNLLFHNYIANKNNVSVLQLQQQVKLFIDENIIGIAPRKWLPATGKHEDYDVTYTLPVGSFGYVRISWRLH